MGVGEVLSLWCTVFGDWIKYCEQNWTYIECMVVEGFCKDARNRFVEERHRQVD